MPTRGPVLSVSTRVIHLGMAICGVAAWLTGEDARDYRDPLVHGGYDLHMWLGIATAAFVGLRLLLGIMGPADARLGRLIPYTRTQWRLIMADLRSLLRFKLPHHETHDGLPGLVQSLGLLLFTFLSVTGVIMAFYITPGLPVTGWVHDMKEMHEAGETLIPAYLILHVGAVLLHAFSGRQLWKKMVFMQ